MELDKPGFDFPVTLSISSLFVRCKHFLLFSHLLWVWRFKFQGFPIFGAVGAACADLGKVIWGSLQGQSLKAAVAVVLLVEVGIQRK